MALIHLSLHAVPGVLIRAADTAGSGGIADPARVLADWTRRDRQRASGFAWSRVFGTAVSIGLHLAALALMVGAAAPDLPVALGESDIEVLDIEFLPSAPESVPVAPATPVVEPRPVVAKAPLILTAPPPPLEIPPAASDPEPVMLAAPAIETLAEPLPIATAAAPASPPDAMPAPAPARPLTARGKRAQSQYLRELMSWLARHRVYPVEAKKRKLEGVVQVRFAIDRDGHLLSATVHRSAGADLLDQAALDVLRRADPMPKFPKALDRDRLRVTLPIDFSLITD